jgi:hypothetical protein
MQSRSGRPQIERSDVDRSPFGTVTLGPDPIQGTIDSLRFLAIIDRRYRPVVPGGLITPTIAIVGLPDKPVSEARERVRSALVAGWHSRHLAPDAAANTRA